MPTFQLLLLLASALPTNPPTFYPAVQTIFTKHCTICHTPAMLDDPESSGGLSLEKPADFLARKTKPIVVAGHSRDSELLMRLIATDPKKRMPKDGEPLSAAEVATIRQWIDGGLAEGIKPTSAGVGKTRLESGRPRREKMLALPIDINAPAGIFRGSKGGPLLLSVPFAPIPAVTAIAFSPAGKILATGSHRQIVIWDLSKATPIALLADPAGMITSLAFTPNGKYLIAVGGEPGYRGEIRVIEAASGKLVHQAEPSKETLMGVAVSPTGNEMVVAGYDRYLRSFRLPGLTPIWEIKAHSDSILAVAYSPAGDLVASGGRDKAVRLWNAKTGATVRSLTGSKEEVVSVVFGKDSSEVISASREPQLRRWTLGSSRTPKVVVGSGHAPAVHQLAIHDKSQMLASVGADRVTRLWKPDGSNLLTLSGAEDVQYSVAISPDANVVASGGAEGITRLWDAKTGKPLARLVAVAFVGNKQTETGWATIAATGHANFGGTLLGKAQWQVGAAVYPIDPPPAGLIAPEVVAKALLGIPESRRPFEANKPVKKSTKS